MRKKRKASFLIFVETLCKQDVKRIRNEIGCKSFVGRRIIRKQKHLTDGNNRKINQILK
jgi:hypothetical protein